MSHRKFRVEAVAARDDRWWVIDVSGYGTTQARRVDDIEAMVIDLVATLEDVDPAAVEVTRLVLRLNGDLDAAVRDAKAAVEAAAEAQTRAGRQQRELVRKLRDRNLSVKEVAAVLGVTPGRVSQLANSAPKRAVPTRRRASA